MKRWMMAGVLVLTQAMVCFSQEEGGDPPVDEPPVHPRFQCFAGVSIGALVGGNQYHTLNDGLEPNPDSLSYLAPTLGIQVFPFENWGLELGSDPVSLTYATKEGTGSTDRTRPLLCYNANNFFGGLVFRYIYDDTRPYRISLNGSLGANYNIVQYNGEFTALFPANYVFYAISPGIGWYATCGPEISLNGPLYIGGRIAYYNLQNRIGKTDYLFDGHLLKLTCYAGVAF